MVKPSKKPEKKKSSSNKSKTNAKMIAISIIIVMVFVSFAVIITTQKGTNLSKNMVFSQDNDNPGNYKGSYQDRNIDLTNVRIQITDSSADSTNSTNLKDKLILETDGNLNCTFTDSNSNGELDPQDEFIVQNADDGDTIRLYLKSSNSEIGFYTFSAPF